MLKNIFFCNTSGKIGLLSKKSVFCFCPPRLVLLLLKAKYQTQIVDMPMFKWHPHLAKAFTYPKHIYKHVEHHGKLSFLGLKVDKPKSI